MPLSPPIRVLIADDAPAARRLVSDALSGDPEIEVVATASDGRQALARLESARPDVVILDLEMPVLGGLATLTEIRRTHPRLPVIVFSAATRQGATSTLEALWHGANDCVAKPRARNAAAAVEQVRRELPPRIKALCRRVEATPRGGINPVLADLAAPPRVPRPIEVVAIGASTGGPRTLATLFRCLPAGLPVPILVVQHMPAYFTRHLAEGLSTRSGLAVQEAVAGTTVEPGRAWMAPGDHHMTVRRQGANVVLEVNQGPPENGCRPSLDPLLRSLAEVYGAGAMALVLTGMGQDGLAGCKVLRRAGGSILVQDEASSVVWGMPGAVARSGLAEAILPPEALAAEVTRRVAGRRCNDAAA